MNSRGLKTLLKSASCLALYSFLAGVLPGPVFAQQAVVLPVPVIAPAAGLSAVGVVRAVTDPRSIVPIAAPLAQNLQVSPVTTPALSLPTVLPLSHLVGEEVRGVRGAPTAFEAPPAVGPVSAKPLHLLITGAPGSGKTTFGKLLAKDYGMVHISVGELLRAQAGSVPGLAETMAKGGLVDSEIVLRIVRERLAQKDVVERGFILDGFPRRLEEAGVIEGWMKDGGRIDAMIQLEVSDDELLRRILARGRMDDSEEVFRNRMEIYRRQTRPVLEHFRERLRVLEAKTEGSDIGANYAKVRALIESALPR
ncbi:MAG: nucleoside monophosphate kinase [Elusimicrobiota bacterium]|jgi:adenylate kinase